MWSSAAPHCFFRVAITGLPVTESITDDQMNFISQSVRFGNVSITPLFPPVGNGRDCTGTRLALIKLI